MAEVREKRQPRISWKAEKKSSMRFKTQEKWEKRKQMPMRLNASAIRRVSNPLRSNPPNRTREEAVRTKAQRASRPTWSFERCGYRRRNCERCGSLDRYSCPTDARIRSRKTNEARRRTPQTRRWPKRSGQSGRECVTPFSRWYRRRKTADRLLPLPWTNWGWKNRTRPRACKHLVR